MKDTHRILTIDGSGIAHVEQRETPPIPPGHVLVKNRASMFSQGTQLGGVKRVRQNPNPDAPARVIGYQSAGDILELGEGCERREVGQPVACMSGGGRAEGVGAYHADYVVVGVNLTSPIPEGVSYDAAASSHLAATALNAVRRAELQFSEDVLVVGLGVVGQFCIRFAELSGARTVGWDLYDIRLETAKKGGARLLLNPAENDPIQPMRDFTRGRGLDAAIIAFGGDSDETFQQVVDVMKVAPDTHQMGRIVIVGGFSFRHQWAASLGNLDVRSAARTGPGFLDVEYETGGDYPPVFVRWTTQRNLEEVLRLMQEGRLDVDGFITHRFPMSRAPEAVDLLVEHPDQAVGVVIDHDE